MNKIKFKIKLAILAVLSAWLPALAVNITGDAAAERIRLAEREVLTFTANGTLTVHSATTVEVLLVGGGGGGGKNKNDTNNYYGGGGGGGGGVVYRETLELQPGDYPIVIGAGGAIQSNGGETTAFGLVAYGGGAGGAYNGNNGQDGASGGGGTYSEKTSNHGGAAIYGKAGNQGFAGGSACHIYGAGGGGGAGEAGESPAGLTGSTPGKGGDGVAYALVGTNVWYGGGGAGFRGKCQIAGGAGGGGSCNKAADGQSSTPGAGADGLGGGGSGGAKGGSGVVIVSFVPTCAASADNTSDFDVSGGDELVPMYEETARIFRNSGTLHVTGTGVVEVLAVGGGGGGGQFDGKTYGAGGGGGGGVVHCTSIFVTEGDYPIVIGAGGEIGATGGETTALGLHAFGGGAGATADSTHVGYDGASGGGAANGVNVYTTTAGGAALWAAYGNKGFAGGSTVHPYGAGGGGGAGEAGESPSAPSESTPGCGGDGYCCTILGTNGWYGGGGAGFRLKYYAAVAGGKGGGGTATLNAEATDSSKNALVGAGVDGFGGGGSGGAAGGSGIVIVRYRKISYETYFSDATGGGVRRRNGCMIHTFTDDGTFTMPVNGLVEVLLVGGGGGGGKCNGDQVLQGGGGGGGGGVVYQTNVVLAAGSYAITIGAGGGVGKNGANTVAFGRVAYGGGAGAKFGGFDGADGASGGGATIAEKSGTHHSGGAAIYLDEGNLGSAGGYATHQYGAGGGGGAGEVGGNSVAKDATSDPSLPGKGGDGAPYTISGEEVYYGGGGAGFRNGAVTAGGKGGGGSNDATAGATDGANGLGGGGCGGRSGGSGVVIIRYAVPRKGFILLVK